LETMEKKSIRVNNLETNISFDIIDVDTFKVNFMGEEINMKWDKIKDYFFGSGSSRSFYFRGEPKEVLRLCKEFGINKEKCFETLKTIKIASEL